MSSKSHEENGYGHDLLIVLHVCFISYENWKQSYTLALSHFEQAYIPYFYLTELSGVSRQWWLGQSAHSRQGKE